MSTHVTQTTSTMSKALDCLSKLSEILVSIY